MTKNWLLLCIAIPSIVFSGVNNNFSYKSSIKNQIEANNHITGTTFHGVSALSLTLPAGLFCLTADRLAQGDKIGAIGSAFLGLAALDYSYHFYKADKQLEKERLDQNERIIDKEIQQEKKERVGEKFL